MEKWTRQAAFDRNWEHFVVNKQPLSFHSNGEDYTCAYRGYDPVTKQHCKCGIGLLIPDEDYIPEMEDKDFSKLRKLFPYLIEDLFEDPDDYYWITLQEIHDYAYDIDSMKPRLKGLALEFNLTVPK